MSAAREVERARHAELLRAQESLLRASVEANALMQGFITTREYRGIRGFAADLANLDVDFDFSVLPVELRAAAHARREFFVARKVVAEARAARTLAKQESGIAVACNVGPVQAMNNMRAALRCLKKLIDEGTEDVDALTAALHEAKMVGVDPRQTKRYEDRHSQLLGQRRFEVCVATLINQFSIEVSGDMVLETLRNQVAEALEWNTACTQLFFDGAPCVDYSRTMADAGVTPHRADFIAVQVDDEVEVTVVETKKRLREEQQDVENLRTRLRLGPSDIEALSKDDKRSKRWTRELITDACTKSLMDFQDAAILIQKLEDKEIAEDQARASVRHTAVEASGEAAPLQNIDDHFIGLLRENEALLGQRKGNLEVAVTRRSQAEWSFEYSKRNAKDARSWALTYERWNGAASPSSSI